jgi:hypothetical protein
MAVNGDDMVVVMANHVVPMVPNVGPPTEVPGVNIAAQHAHSQKYREGKQDASHGVIS